MMTQIKDFLNKDRADAQIVILSYNETLRITQKTIVKKSFEIEFKNVFKLFFHGYLNGDISEIKSSFSYNGHNICKIFIISAFTNKEIVSFACFID